MSKKTTKDATATSEAHRATNHYGDKEGLRDTIHKAPDTETPVVHVQPPEELTGLKRGQHKTIAAGLPAVLSSMQYALRETGPIRGTRLLTTMNQKDGFDCSSCAWPDPDSERSVAEFCENGA